MWLERSAGKLRCGSAAALLLCGALCALACGGLGDAYDRVVLVSVDSLRGDHLGINGYVRPTTPFLDELASQGAVFDRAYAASARSTLSLASLLTGLPPHEHGLRGSGDALDPALPTLAGRLAERGFRSAGFVSVWAAFEPTGLARAFAHFDGPPELAEHPYRAADRTVDAALAWLEQQDDGTPLFVYLQLQDPTRPFRAPAVYLQAVTEGTTEPDYYGYLEREHGVPLGWYGWEHVRANAVFGNYDAELRFVDTELRRLRDGLDTLGLLDRTLFVVTSEHGTGLGNHFWDTAGQVLYEEQVRVPLIIAAADGSVAPRRVPDVVSQQDVLPTILALLGGEAAEVASTPATGGRSLTPLLDGGRLEPRPAFFERGRYKPLSKAQENQVVRSPIPPGPGPLVGGVDPRWKLLVYGRTRAELYDLENDPFERENLLADGAAPPPEVEALRGQVAQLLSLTRATSAGKRRSRPAER